MIVEDNAPHAKMFGKYIGKILTEEKRQRWIHLLLQTADELDFKNNPEFRSVFLRYPEWRAGLLLLILK